MDDLPAARTHRSRFFSVLGSLGCSFRNPSAALTAQRERVDVGLMFTDKHMVLQVPAFYRLELLVCPLLISVGFETAFIRLWKYCAYDSV